MATGWLALCIPIELYLVSSDASKESLAWRGGNVMDGVEMGSVFELGPPIRGSRVRGTPCDTALHSRKHCRYRLFVNLSRRPFEPYALRYALVGIALVWPRSFCLDSALRSEDKSHKRTARPPTSLVTGN